MKTIIIVKIITLDEEELSFYTEINFASRSSCSTTSRSYFRQLLVEIKQIEDGLNIVFTTTTNTEPTKIHIIYRKR